MRERALQTKIVEALGNIYYIKIISASVSGHPDIVICKDGRFIGVEIKGDGGRLSPLQRLRLKLIRANGGAAYLVSPKNFKWVRRKMS